MDSNLRFTVDSNLTCCWRGYPGPDHPVRGGVIHVILSGGEGEGRSILFQLTLPPPPSQLGIF